MINSGMTVEAKLQLLKLLAREQMKVALYTAAADVGPHTKEYTARGECTGKGYKAGGVALRNPRVWMDGTSACLTWDSPTLPVASISANGFMIYSPSLANTAIFVGAYNGTFTSTEGPFKINIASDQLCLD